MTLSKKNVQIVPLLIITLGLVTYNFMSAQWKGPTAAPPDSNTAAPINEGTTTQSKLGNFNANILSAATSTWSPRYCDELGKNCWDPATGVPGGSTGITSLTGGSGIILSPTTITSTGIISINTTYTQRRITGTCPAGQAIRQINVDGTVVCQASAATCLWKGVTYSQGASCRTGSLSCFSGGSGYTMQTCANDGTWQSGSTGCSLSQGTLQSCP